MFPVKPLTTIQITTIDASYGLLLVSHIACIGAGGYCLVYCMIDTQ